MKITNLSRLKRFLTLAGASALSMGLLVSTAFGAWTAITPDMFGPYPNYANSPLPVEITTIPPVLADYGNPINADQPYATDYPPITDPYTQLAPVLVVLPSAVLPTGTLKSFSTWNQATAGASPTPSHGDPALGTNGLLYAYVLRPTGVPNEYSAVYSPDNLAEPGCRGAVR